MKKEANKVCPIRPTPNVIVSCRDKDGKNNALAVGFVSNASIDPPMVMVGIVPERFSYPMVKESGVFAINIPAKDFEKEYFYLGTKSGKDEDKFAVLGIEWENGEKVDVPLLAACPVCIECRVVDFIKPGSHELFIGSVEAVHCDDEYLNEDGSIDWGKIALI